MKESIPQLPGLSQQTEEYFTNWYRITALDSGNSADYTTEHTGDSIVFTCASTDTFRTLLKMHTDFPMYPNFVDVVCDEEKQSFTFKDKAN